MHITYHRTDYFYKSSTQANADATENRSRCKNLQKNVEKQNMLKDFFLHCLYDH